MGIPTKKPPPRVAAVRPKLSITVIILHAASGFNHHYAMNTTTLIPLYWYNPVDSNIDRNEHAGYRMKTYISIF